MGFVGWLINSFGRTGAPPPNRTCTWCAERDPWWLEGIVRREHNVEMIQCCFERHRCCFERKQLSFTAEKRAPKIPLGPPGQNPQLYLFTFGSLNGGRNCSSVVYPSTRRPRAPTSPPLLTHTVCASRSSDSSLSSLLGDRCNARSSRPRFRKPLLRWGAREPHRQSRPWRLSSTITTSLGTLST